MLGLHKKFMFALLEQWLYQSDADEKVCRSNPLKSSHLPYNNQFWLFKLLTVVERLHCIQMHDTCRPFPGPF